MTAVTVVDYGIGNVFSVCNAIAEAGGNPSLISAPAEIRNADRLILPGVGAFGRAMEALTSLGISDALIEFVETGRPFLGICIGMQVLMERSSEFGSHEGLGLIPGEVWRIESVSPTGKSLRVPHIGWSAIKKVGDAKDWLSHHLQVSNDAFYFVHSFHCRPANLHHRIAFVDYEDTEITAVVQKDNILGVQFHPERSGQAGQRLLRSYLAA